MLAASAAAVAVMVGLVPVARAASVTQAADQRTAQVSTNDSSLRPKVLARAADGTPAKIVTASSFESTNATVGTTSTLGTGASIRQLTSSFAAEPWSDPYQQSWATKQQHAGQSLSGSDFNGAPWVNIVLPLPSSNYGVSWVDSINLYIPRGYNNPAQWNRNVSQYVTQYVHYQWSRYGSPSGQFEIKSYTAYWDASKQLLTIKTVNENDTNGYAYAPLMLGSYYWYVELIPTQQQYDERYPGADKVTDYVSVTGGGLAAGDTSQVNQYTYDGTPGIYPFGTDSMWVSDPDEYWYGQSGTTSNVVIPISVTYPVWDSSLTIKKTWNSTETKPDSVTVCVFQNASPDTPNINGTGATNTTAGSSSSSSSTSDANTDRTCSASGTNDDYDTVTLDAANDWTQTIYVPAGPQGHVYTAVEAPVAGYTPTYSASVQNVATSVDDFSNTSTSWPNELTGELPSENYSSVAASNAVDLKGLLSQAGTIDIANTDLPEPAHAKYVSKNSDGTYDLHLDVTGKTLTNTTDGTTITNAYRVYSITDALSGNDEPVPTQWNENTSQDITKYVTLTASDSATLPDYKAYWEATTRTIKVTFDNGNGFVPADGVTYTISFKVQPVQKDYDTRYPGANTTAAYPDTGDAGTGSTSAGQKGFYSNSKNATVVDWARTTTVTSTPAGSTTPTTTTTTGAASDSTYPMPVIQTAPSTITVKKTWNVPDHPGSATVCVFQSGADGKDQNGATEGTSCSASGSNDDYDTLVLDSANDWTATITVPAGPQGYTYRVAEAPVSGWRASYSVTVPTKPSAAVGADSADLKGLTSQSADFTIANTAGVVTSASNGTTPMVTKKVVGTSTDDDFRFLLTPANAATSDAIASGAVTLDSGSDPATPATSETVTVDGPFSDGGSKSAQFQNIDFSKPGVYSFDIAEQGTAPAGWVYDTSDHVVTYDVTETGGVFAISSVTGNDPVVVNRYVVVYGLPMTGGSTARCRAMLWAGAVLALVAAGAYALWKRRNSDK